MNNKKIKSGCDGGAVSGNIDLFVRNVRLCTTSLYVPPYTPLLRRGVRGNVKTSLTHGAISAGRCGGGLDG